MSRDREPRVGTTIHVDNGCPMSAEWNDTYGVSINVRIGEQGYINTATIFLDLDAARRLETAIGQALRDYHFTHNAGYVLFGTDNDGEDGFDVTKIVADPACGYPAAGKSVDTTCGVCNRFKSDCVCA